MLNLLKLKLDRKASLILTHALRLAVSVPTTKLRFVIVPQARQRLASVHAPYLCAFWMRYIHFRTNLVRIETWCALHILETDK
jgi:hypothetical protein